MKTWNIVILGAVLLLGMSSCQNAFEFRTERIVGKWAFSEATERVRRSLRVQQSIFDQYNGDEIEFLDNNTFYYTEVTDTGIVLLEGIWSLTSVDMQASEDSDTEFILTMSMNDIDGKLAQYTWEINMLTHRHLCAIETTEDYEYRYELTSLEH